MARFPLRMTLGTGLAALALSGARAQMPTAQTPMVPPMKDFVTAAAQSDHFEILEAQTALAQTHDPRVRAFAQEMVRAHTRTSETLQAAATKVGMDKLPSGINGDEQKMLIALQSQRGPEFDHVYLKQQAIADDEALVLEQAYVSRGDNAAVRQAAASAVPVIRHHLEMAKRLRGEVGGS